MDDPTLIKWALGLITTMGLLLIGRTHAHAKDAHRRIDSESKSSDEKINMIYEKIAHTAERAETSRLEVYRDIQKIMSSRMTETQVKDFVDRAISPIQKEVSEANAGIKELLRNQ